ncbi:hypothetical protein [Desulfosporosinus sp. BG]|uniref:hypothetical protein n=1 Tax=Desulfosporosinus sp. BG TaxID=1633135 RepID=UPI00083A275F|nr:hypothetical protein [Desulfosporosinus sp. BG]
MYDFLLLVIIPNLIVVPVAYFAGYQLRDSVPLKQRLFVGFEVVLIILTFSFVLSREFKVTPFSRLNHSVTTAIATGFPLGIAGPPFNDPKRKNMRK